MRGIEKFYINDILIVKVNHTRATQKEALKFKEILQAYAYEEKIKVIIDLSQCEFMDSTFLGAIVFVNRKIRESEGKLILVESIDFNQLISLYTTTIRLFEVYPNLEDAVNSFKMHQNVQS